MNPPNIHSIILSLLIAVVASPVILQAADLIDQSSNIFKFQQKLASSGNVQAQFKLATMYEAGDGVEKNIDEAKHWYSVASKAGSQAAVRRSTYLRIKEKGFDASRDTEWLNGIKNDAANREPDAIYLLGHLYRDGVGVKKDLNESLALFKQIRSLGEANVGREIVSINKEMEADKRAQKYKQKEDRAQQVLKAEQAQQAEKAQAAEQVRQEAKQASNEKQKAADEERIKAEKRKQYEAVMLKLKREQQQIDEQQSLVTDSSVTADDEI